MLHNGKRNHVLDSVIRVSTENLSMSLRPVNIILTNPKVNVRTPIGSHNPLNNIHYRLKVSWSL